jgi:transcriptional regulator with XRE-family HTH domain
MFPEFKWVASNVRRLRTEVGWTQAELATAAECGIAVIARLERAEVSAQLLTLLKVAKALETSIVELFAPADWTAPYRGRPK